MSQPSPDQSEILLSIADLERAAAEGVLSYAEVREIAAWADKQSLPRSPLIKAPAEHRKGLNLVTVIYYFGALLMISACAWFLGDKWDVLQAKGICVVVVAYMLIAFTTGVFLRRYEYTVAGGLLITVGVSLTPLLVYSVERMV